VKAFKSGMSPIIVTLLIASGVVLAGANGNGQKDWGLLLLVGITVLIVVHTKIPMLLLLFLGGCGGCGGCVGALGVFG